MRYQGGTWLHWRVDAPAVPYAVEITDGEAYPMLAIVSRGKHHDELHCFEDVGLESGDDVDVIWSGEGVDIILNGTPFRSWRIGDEAWSPAGVSGS